MSKQIAKVVVGLPLEGPFDYSVSTDIQRSIQVGMRVLISFNRRKIVGYVVGFASESAFKRLNPIMDILDQYPALTKNSLFLAESLSKYYGCSLGEAIESILPAFLRKKKKYEMADTSKAIIKSEDHPSVILIADKTHDKRWEEILKKANAVISGGKSILFLVPETVMIKNVVSKLSEKLDCAIIAIGKKISSKKEEENWINVLKLEPKVVVGTRSLIFCPVNVLGLIVVFDEENSSYKQEQSPYYHACEVANMRAKIDHCDLIFVSSAPSAERWHKFSVDKSKRIEIQADSMSEMKLVDLTNYNPRRTSKLSFPLQSNIDKTLKANGKIILFMNRKGFFTMTSCNECGFVLKCQRCEVNIT